MSRNKKHCQGRRFKRRFGRSSASHRKTRPLRWRAGLLFEPLEDRLLLAVFSTTFQDISPNNSDLDFFGNPDPANFQGPDPDGENENPD